MQEVTQYRPKARVDCVDEGPDEVPLRFFEVRGGLETGARKDNRRKGPRNDKRYQ